MFKAFLLIGILAALSWYALMALETRSDRGKSQPVEARQEQVPSNFANEPVPPARKEIPSAPFPSATPSRAAEQGRQGENAATAAKGTAPLSDELAQRIANTGLTSDSSRPSLGQSYRDRRGLIWGEIKRKPGETKFNDAASWQLPFDEAMKFCKDEGNRLPAREDYEKLIRDFGVKDGDGHIAVPTDDEFAEIVRRSQGGDMFPNGGYNPFRETYGANIFPTLTFQRVWTSTPAAGERGTVYVFNSSLGLFQKWEIAGNKLPFLCVYNPREHNLKK